MTCFRMDDGETLRQYCLKNNIDYTSIYFRVTKGESINKAIKNYLRVRKYRKGCRYIKYFVNDKPITYYTNGVESNLYKRVRYYIHELNKTPEEALKMCGVSL